MLTVFYPCDTPELTVLDGEENGWYVEGETFDTPTIECRLNNVGNPPARLMLRKSNVTVAEVVSSNISYHVESFEADDDGAEFHCEAWNAAETYETSSGSLTSPPVLRSAEVEVRVAFGPHHLKITEAPSGAGVVDSVKVNSGESIKLTCKAWSSNPLPNLEWIRPPNGSIFDDFPLQNVIFISILRLRTRILRK